MAVDSVPWPTKAMLISSRSFGTIVFNLWLLSLRMAQFKLYSIKIINLASIVPIYDHCKLKINVKEEVFITIKLKEMKFNKLNIDHE